MRSEAKRRNDEEAVAQMKKRLEAGREPTAKQLRAERRLKHDVLLELAETGIPPSVFETLTGLSASHRKAWEDQYSIPCGLGRELINIAGVFGAIRSLIASHKKILASNGQDVSLVEQKLELEVERLKEQIRRLQNQSEVLEGSYCRVEVMRERIVRISAELKRLGETFSRKRSISGKDAQQMLNATLQNVGREVKKIGR